MKPLWELLFAASTAFFLAADGPAVKPQASEEAAVAALKALDAQVQLDDDGYAVSVNFRENQKLNDADLASLAKLSRLRFLSLHNTPITDAGLAHLANSAGLQTLLLGKTKITDKGFVHLKGLADLQTLNLTGTAVTGSGLEHLAAAKKLGFFYAGNSQFSDAGMAHLKNHPNLRRLFLSGSKITDAGLVHLAGFDKISCLLLQETAISDAGLAHLANVKGVGYLWLEGTNVTDAGLVHLKGMSKLGSVGLSGTKVTDAGVAELRKALPKCGITNDPDSAARREETGRRRAGEVRESEVRRQKTGDRRRETEDRMPSFPRSAWERTSATLCVGRKTHFCRSALRGRHRRPGKAVLQGRGASGKCVPTQSVGTRTPFSLLPSPLLTPDSCLLTSISLTRAVGARYNRP